MTFPFGTTARTLLLAVALTLPFAAQAEDATPYPDYIFEEYGTPPEIPTGPLSHPTSRPPWKLPLSPA